MRSWLAQSLRALEDLVDSGELTAEELAALARSPLMPTVSTIPPSFEAHETFELDEPPASVHVPPSHRSGTMTRAAAEPAIAKTGSDPKK